MTLTAAINPMVPLNLLFPLQRVICPQSRQSAKYNILYNSLLIILLMTILPMEKTSLSEHSLYSFVLWPRKVCIFPSQLGCHLEASCLCLPHKNSTCLFLLHLESFLNTHCLCFAQNDSTYICIP